jgi:hypothetical protein
VIIKKKLKQKQLKNKINLKKHNNPSPIHYYTSSRSVSPVFQGTLRLSEYEPFTPPPKLPTAGYTLRNVLILNDK